MPVLQVPDKVAGGLAAADSREEQYKDDSLCNDFGAPWAFSRIVRRLPGAPSSSMDACGEYRSHFGSRYNTRADAGMQAFLAQIDSMSCEFLNRGVATFHPQDQQLNCFGLSVTTREFKRQCSMEALGKLILGASGVVRLVGETRFESLLTCYRPWNPKIKKIFKKRLPAA